MGKYLDIPGEKAGDSTNFVSIPARKTSPHRLLVLIFATLDILKGTSLAVSASRRDVPFKQTLFTPLGNSWMLFVKRAIRFLIKKSYQRTQCYIQGGVDTDF